MIKHGAVPEVQDSVIDFIPVHYLVATMLDLSGSQQDVAGIRSLSIYHLCNTKSLPLSIFLNL